MKYLFPNNPNSLSPKSSYFKTLDNNPDWIAEVKKNGFRCVVHRDEQGVWLWTKAQTIITIPLPEIRGVLESLPLNCMLDGELINYKRIKGSPNRLYLFDILVHKGNNVCLESLADRRMRLEFIYRDYLLCPEIELAEQFTENKVQLFYDSVEGNENEGIVIKKLSSVYKADALQCLDNPNWLKVKKVEGHIKIGGSK